MGGGIVATTCQLANIKKLTVINLLTYEESLRNSVSQAIKVMVGEDGTVVPILSRVSNASYNLAPEDYSSLAQCESPERNGHNRHGRGRRNRTLQALNYWFSKKIV